MHLNELPVGVRRARGEASGRRGSGAHHRVGALAKDQARSTSCHHHRIGGKRADGHGAKVLRHDPSASTIGVDDGAQEFPVLVLADVPF